MYKDTYWSEFCHNILKNKKLIFFSIFVTIMCYGFAITHFSIGVDDPARIYYLYSNNIGNMIQQGRLLHVLLNKLTGSVAFIPFFNDFIAASLFCLSALLFCTLFQYISDNHFSCFALITFVTVYISYSIINEKFIYNLDVIVTMLSYCTGALALSYAYIYISQNNHTAFFMSVFLLIISISSYESFIFLYICGVFSIFIIQIIVKNQEITIGKCIKTGLRYASILVLAVVIYYTLVFGVQIATNQYGIFVRQTLWNAPCESNFWGRCLYIGKSIVYPFVFAHSFPLNEFLIFALIGLVLVLYFSIRKKSNTLFLCYIAYLTSTLGISFFSGTTILRAALTFCFFVSFIAMLLVQTFAHRNIIKKAFIVGIIFLVFVQSADLNQSFYNDYIRYEKEKAVIDSVAIDIMNGYDLSKPIVFCGQEGINYLNTKQHAGAQSNGNSVINWALCAFSDPTTPILFDLFYMQGYDFMIKPTEQQAIIGDKFSKSMPNWPQAGYINEFDDIIVVNLG